MIKEATSTHAETDLPQLIADQMSAICAKDLDRLMGLYAADAVIFDVKPPFQIQGVDALRRMWEACLPCFPDSLRIETRDFTITVSGDLAFAHWLFRFTGEDRDHPACQTWIRTTAAYRRHEGRWRILHEHLSVPFDPETGRAAFTLEP